MQGVDGGGPHSGRRRVFLLVGSELPSHPKIDFYQTIVSESVAPHGCKYLANQEELLLDGALADRFCLVERRPW